MQDQMETRKVATNLTKSMLVVRQQNPIGWSLLSATNVCSRGSCSEDSINSAKKNSP